MENARETQYPKMDYQEIAAAFSREAASLLSETSIRQTLEKEGRRFENAQALHISPGKFVGSNTARHCKELLRRNQPLFPLYLLCSFLAELSTALLLFGLIFAGFRQFLAPGESFSRPYPVWYGGLAITGILLFRYVSREIWGRLLSQKTDKPEKLLPAVRIRLALAGLAIALACAGGIAWGIWTGVQHFQITILNTLILYTACMLLACVHNLVYDSHILLFLTVGACLLNPRSAISPAEAALRYQKASMEQLLSRKDGEALSSPETTGHPTGEFLRPRLRSFRIYAILAAAIFLALDVLCTFQILHQFSLPLLAFSLASLCGSFLCLLVFLSARTILKSL